MIRLIQLKKKDANDIATIHIASFNGFFLTDLGKDVLRVFYSSLLKDKSTIVWGVKNNEELVGFFVASTKPSGLYSRIFLNNFLYFLGPLLISFLKNLTFLKRMITSFTSSNSYIVSPLYSASLLSICVSPQYSGNGIGKMLLNKLENELLINNQKGYYLTTDAENNEGTNYFYISNGFKIHNVYCQGKRIMNIYIKKLI